ncbi:hypothetical protein G7054_g3146 [Neopestalotiopsis clavispora]|nr:hypothetical protein G7054_g3146 [Neopestalotiopsis clavispora]
MEPYRYETLGSPDSIRLLLLEPASNKDDDLVGTLVSQTLSAWEDDLNTHYAALSYVWGSSTRTNSIKLLSGQTEHLFALTSNLHMALTDLREEHRQVWIWADAICIDQDNNEERGHQVKMMGEIYRNAGCTVIWLGSLTVNILDIFKPGESKEAARLTYAIECLCSDEWFTRGWVFQELVLSHNPRIQCGKRRIGWNVLRATIQQLQWSRGAVSRFHNMDKARNDHTSRDFFQLVVSRSGAQVSDPRDFFFCLMGVASDAAAVQEQLPVDYSLDIRDVFTRAAKYMIENVGLDSVFQHVKSELDDYGLPSFVPTWGIPDLHTLLYKEDENPLEPTWGERDMLRDALVLTIPRLEILHITELGEVLPQYTEFMEALRESLETLLDCHERLLDTSKLSVGSHLQGLWEYWTELEDSGILSSREKVTWVVFCSIILGRDPPRENLLFPGSRRGNRLQSQKEFHRLEAMLERLMRRLSFCGEQDDATPPRRLALCGDRVVIVPADTLLGDMVVNLEPDHDQLSDSHFRYHWFVVRPAGHRLFEGEQDQLVDYIRWQQAPTFQTASDHLALSGAEMPMETDVHFVQVKGNPKFLKPLFHTARSPIRPGVMVLI